ncbi:DUF2934 domain-containing protein [Ancylobacter sp. SL191]|uniref:DUF2934 domain-containing protein n=1 Tax=Ancylobacter sp. SL191 TaxID=2995166 RepID=UPI00227146B7|nr:DUF2934 domain-containing protein [Ancylobacter sp. SL191]WAC27173.1 DUF2934 domain-containing protein [Ancylobacter sp. SL191]
MNEREQRIREHAYRLWESDGQPAGREHDHWLRAERAHDGAGAEQEQAGMRDDNTGNGSLRSSDAAEAPPVPMPPGALDYPDEPDHIAPPSPNPANAEPNVGITGGEVEPVSEIASIRRTLEVPPSRRGEGSPAGDPEGAMSGNAGARHRRPGV